MAKWNYDHCTTTNLYGSFIVCRVTLEIVKQFKLNHHLYQVQQQQPQSAKRYKMMSSNDCFALQVAISPSDTCIAVLDSDYHVRLFSTSMYKQ